MKIFLAILLICAATTIATASIASNVSLSTLPGKIQTVLFDANDGPVEPNGDPVEGGGGGPGNLP